MTVVVVVVTVVIVSLGDVVKEDGKGKIGEREGGCGFNGEGDGKR